MVKRGMDGAPGRLDVGEVKHPAQHGIDVAADGQFDLERMAVQARAGMGFRQGRQAARTLQVEDAEDVHVGLSRMSAALAMRRLSNTGGPGYTMRRPVLLWSDHVGVSSVGCRACRTRTVVARRMLPRQWTHPVRARCLCSDLGWLVVADRCAQVC